MTLHQYHGIRRGVPLPWFSTVSRPISDDGASAHMSDFSTLTAVSSVNPFEPPEGNE